MNREDLLRQIREVFPDPVWPRTKLAAIHDLGDLDCRYIVDHYQGKRWTELSREELGWMSQDSWAFAEKALPFFFPAWLSEDVRDPDHAWQSWNIAGSASSQFVKSFSIEQRLVAYHALIFVYGDETPWADDDHLQELIRSFSLTMTMRTTPKGTITIGSIEEVHAHQLQEWREMSKQDKADLFVELMRFWRSNASGLDRTARIVEIQ